MIYLALDEPYYDYEEFKDCAMNSVTRVPGLALTKMVFETLFEVCSKGSSLTSIYGSL